MMYAVVIYSLVTSHITFVDILTPPQKFEQLEVMEGSLQSLNKAGRRSYSRMVLQKENGDKYTFKIYLDGGEWTNISKLKGSFLQIYYDYDIHPLLYRERIAKAVKCNDVFLRKYDHYERSMEVYNFDKILFASCAGVVLALLLCIYMKNREESDAHMEDRKSSGVL